MTVESGHGVRIRRVATPVLYPFTDYFTGFESVKALQDLFGEKLSEVLSGLRVEFYSGKWGYMSTSDEDGHLLISTYHLRNSPFNTIYLDILHELFHVKQFLDGRQLFDDRYDYVDSPVEIEAYEFTIKEARKIGMDEDEIADYLRVNWISEDEFRRFLDRLGVVSQRTK